MFQLANYTSLALCPECLASASRVDELALCPCIYSDAKSKREQVILTSAREVACSSCQGPCRKSSSSREVSRVASENRTTADRAILQDKVKKKKKSGNKSTEADDGLAEIESGNATGESARHRSMLFKLNR